MAILLQSAQCVAFTLQEHQDHSGRPQGAPITHNKTKTSAQTSVPPRIRETHQQNGGIYNSSKRRAGVEPVRCESREGGSQTVWVDMEGMQGIEAMLRSMLEAQEKLAHQVGELAEKIDSQQDQMTEMINRVGGGDENVRAVGSLKRDGNLKRNGIQVLRSPPRRNAKKYVRYHPYSPSEDESSSEDEEEDRIIVQMNKFARDDAFSSSKAPVAKDGEQDITRPLKRKRGRPASKATLMQRAREKKISESPLKVRRGPGRPPSIHRLIGTHVQVQAVSKPEDGNVVPVKRKAGRPRKGEGSEGTAQAVAKPEDGNVVPVKRKAGRPRKGEGSEGNAQAVAKPEDGNDTLATIVPVKRKAGRPRKGEGSEGNAQAVAKPEDGIDTLATIVPVKRKAGRPRKEERRPPLRQE
jgi:hypothetical protein